MRSISGGLTALLSGLAVMSLHSPLANADGPPTRYTLPKLEVKVVNTPSVIVKNNATSPVPVQIVPGAADEYFFASGYVRFINGGGIQPVVTVPAGRRYLIEYVSAFCIIQPAGPLGGLGLGVRPAGDSNYRVHRIMNSPVTVSSGGSTVAGYITAGTPIHMEAPAGAEIGGQILAGNSAASSNCEFSVSGRSIPAS